MVERATTQLNCATITKHPQLDNGVKYRLNDKINLIIIGVISSKW